MFHSRADYWSGSEGHITPPRKDGSSPSPTLEPRLFVEKVQNHPLSKWFTCLFCICDSLGHRTLLPVTLAAGGPIAACQEHKAKCFIYHAIKYLPINKCLTLKWRSDSQQKPTKRHTQLLNMHLHWPRDGVCLHKGLFTVHTCICVCVNVDDSA